MLFRSEWAKSGIQPETPITIQNLAGEKVTFVVADRTEHSSIAAAQALALAELLGEDGAAQILVEYTTFSFNEEILAIPGVITAVEKALTPCLKRLVEKKLLSQEQADSFVVALQKRFLRPGTFKRLPEICGRQVERIRRFLDAVGSALTRYVRV